MRNGILILVLSGLLSLDSFEPARYESGELFTQPPMTLGGGEVLLELGVAASGEVSDVTVLRTTPPFGDLLVTAVRGWRFAPAREVQEDADVPVDVDSKVLVVGFFRPPTFYDAPARGEVPVDVAPPTREVPFPTTMVAPLYPPQVYFHMSQTVGVEVEVGLKGEVTSSKVVRPAESADLSASAMDAAKEWRFRPARRDGRTVRSVAYIVFGFRELVVSGS
jgi:TonB family protein